MSEKPGRRLEVKMAKASKDDIDEVRKFFQMIEEYMEYRTITEGDSEPRRINEDEFLQQLKHHWRGNVECSWSRVVYGCDILIDNCCDPEARTLEWRKDLAELMEQKSQP